MSRLIAVLDANVLYGITPTDLLITLAVRDAYRPHWSEAILDEAIRTSRPTARTSIPTRSPNASV